MGLSHRGSGGMGPPRKRNSGGLGGVRRGGPRRRAEREVVPPDHGVLSDGEAVGQHLAERGFGPRRHVLRPDIGGKLSLVVGLWNRDDLAQGSVHPAEAQVRPEKRQPDWRLVDHAVHQSGVGRIPLPRHRSLRAHSRHLRTAPGAAMGGSFPGIIVPAANQLSVPQSGNWCGLESGFADSERRSTMHVKRARERHAKPASERGPSGPARAAGAGGTIISHGGSLHDANFR